MLQAGVKGTFQCYLYIPQSPDTRPGYLITQAEPVTMRVLRRESVPPVESHRSE